MGASSAEALALLRAGRAAEAEQRLRQAIRAAPNDAPAIHLLGFVLATGGRAGEGLALIDRSIELDPGNPGYLDNRAQVLLREGRADEAVRDAREVTRLAPAFADGWLHLAQALRRQGAHGESLAAAQRALAIEPRHAAAAYHAALVHLDAGDAAAAERGFEQALAIDPRHVAALNNLGILQRGTNREALALESFARAVAADPSDAPSQNNFGLALQGAGRLAEAFGAFVRAGYPESLANAAGLALELERLDDARGLYARAAALKPGFADALYGLGQVALREHRFAEGWEGYERRFDTNPPLAQPRVLPLPRLDRAGLGTARRVAIWSEQGLGDQILFSTLLPELERRGVGAVVEIDPRLLALYRRSLPDFEFVSPGQSARAFEGCDAQLPMGSLPLLFRPDVASFSAQPRALLSPDPMRVEAIARELGAQPAIAISWRSLQAPARRALGERKSLALETFAALAHETGARLVDLQYGDVDDERREFDARHPGSRIAIAGLDAREDLEGVAAALAACGRLVTTSNATAHLAGALGIPTRIWLPRGWPPFSYWAPAPGGRSLWYPSVMIETAPTQGGSTP